MPVHANSLANLKSFPPGQSGNPGGRPRGGGFVAAEVDADLLEDVHAGVVDRLDLLGGEEVDPGDVALEFGEPGLDSGAAGPVSYTHLRAHET